MPTMDVCYGPIATGQFFVDRLNPERPMIWEITGTYSPQMTDLFICTLWGMNESVGEWSFGKFQNESGWQIARCRIEEMERVSKLRARHLAEQKLRHDDDEWRKQWGSTRDPVKIVRCTCGVGDYAERTRHTIGCFCRQEGI